MDIENMHPFCMPFSLCHDATSSSIVDDDEMECKMHTTRDIRDKLNNNNNDEDRIKLKHDSLPPIGDLLDSLDASRRSPLLRDHESFIDASVDHDDAYHSLHLDIDMSTEDEFGLRDFDQDDNHDFEKNDNDWHFSISATHDCPLFSPSGSIAASAKHKARHHHHNPKGSPCPSIFSTHHHHHHHHQHQVFQHVVDPIDIKSSPTLAQLNLNSNDDPTDGLWTTAGGGSHGASSSTNASYLATSSTSTLISSTTHLHRQNQSSLSSLLSSTNSDLLASSFPNHHHHHCNGASSTATTNSMNSTDWCSASNSHQSNNLPTTCNHFNNTLNHQQLTCNTHLSSCHHHQAPQQINNVQNTTLAKKNINQLQNQQHIDLAHQHHQQSNGVTVNRTSSCSCQSHHQTLMGHDLNQLNGGAMGQSNQQRCPSPAPLVTSSSSPLSSQSSMHPNGCVDGRIVGSTDIKLKENIEYLTVLLCNGSNKLDMTNNQVQQQQQQPPNSSTMVKSYSILAQSLSTGPKLLERYQQHGPAGGHTHQLNHLNMQPSIALTSGCAQPTLPNCVANEVLPQCVAQLNHNQVMPNNCIHSNPNGTRRVCSDNQWLKPPGVESSVSAADSTAENQHVLSPHGTTMGASQARPGDMKVLSSLLSSNKYRSPFASDPPAYTSTPVWADANHTGGSARNSSHVQAVANDSANSIPANGRPITLTPHNNVIIPQRQQQNINNNNKPKANQPTFAQPASPSTSSTTSSSGNLEIGSSSSSSTWSNASSTKKPRQSSSSSSSSSAASSTKKGDKQKDGQQVGGTRLNSLTSADGSLSSHDEGFSSQMDQDDCANSIRGNESDDESDIDSDDESFYGDYTNSDLIGASISDNPECKWTLNMGRTRRNGQRRFFWQYNVQSKGPKGTRICPADGAENPFVLPEASDPVFSNECQIEGVKHSGKARRGDGNDLTPNPRKLLMIGLELKKLSKIINELAPVTDLPVNARNKTRKEKNKLASRACRLKKKAQHEANKIKLYGLQQEHQQIVISIYDARKTINKSLAGGCDEDENDDAGSKKQAYGELSSFVKELLDQCSITVAGQTSDYVNSVLEKVVSGCIDGGLQT